MGDVPATTRSSAARAIVRALQQRGLPGSEIARSVGVTAEMLADTSARIATASMQRLWRAAVDASGEPAIGLEVLPFLSVDSFGAAGMAVLGSATLEQALRRIVRFFPWGGSGVVLSLVESPRHVRVALDGVGDPPAAQEGIEMSMAILVWLLNRLGGAEPVLPTAASLVRVRPASTARFELFFGPGLRFDAGRNALEFSREDLRRETGNQAATPGLTAASFAADDAGAAGEFSARVRALVVEHLPDGVVTERFVAGELAMSVRSVQWRLQQEGTSYRRIVRDIRFVLARAHLAEGVLPVKWIAALLGYADTAAFSKAYRQWSGMSPRRSRDAGRVSG
jgi:AraC-like DNA-binding protein